MLIQSPARSTENRKTLSFELVAGEIIAEHHINPEKNYQPKTRHQEEQ
ncbi:MAG: hypothetical protein GX678_08420 [Actinomycetales bacterium]|nr:hypothetical protein [Actinomycetales bacterium]